MERKVCVVTGSSSGIGAATARLYAERGWNVVVNYSREAAPAEAVAAPSAVEAAVAALNPDAMSPREAMEAIYQLRALSGT